MANDDELGIVVRIKEVAKAVAESNRIKSAIKSIGDATKTSSKELSSLSRQGLSTFSGLGRAVQSVSSNVLQYSGIATAAGGAVLGFGLKAASGLEQTNISMTKLLGSQPAATKMIKQLQDFANTTPFDFDQTMGAATSLLAQNFKPDELIRTLTAISDTTAATGKGAQGFNSLALVLAQMRNEAKLNTRDLYQMTDAGVDGLGILADAAHKTRSEMMDLVGEGKVSGQQAGEVVTKGLEAKFGGMSVAQGKTLGAQWSNFIGKIKSSLYTVDGNGKVGGTLGPLVQMLERNLDSIQRKGGPVEKVMNGLGKAVRRFVGDITYLNRGYKLGGTDQLLESFGNLIGLGDRLVPIWHHIRDDSKLLGQIWQNSLWPAIRNVASALAPFAYGELRALEGILHWMAENPDAAARIFTALGIALAVWGIESAIFGVVGAVKAVTLGFGAAQLAVLKYSGALKGLSMLTGIGAGAPMLGAGAGAAGAGTAAAGGVGGAGVGAAAGGLGLGTIAGVAGSVGAVGVAGYELFRQQLSARKLMQNPRAWFGGKAGGGTQSVSGTTLVGEQGPELVHLPGGAAVNNNKQLMSALSSGNSGRQVRIEKGAINISGTDVLNNHAVADILLRQIEDRLARQ